VATYTGARGDAAKADAAPLTADDVRRVLSSIGDNNSYLRDNRDIVDDMIAALKREFSASSEKRHLSLEIRCGREGSKLSHSHATQFDVRMAVANK
jgi:hypothetical protein